MTLGLLPMCALDAFVELWTRAQALLVLSLTHAVYTHPVRLQGYGAATGCFLQVPRHRADLPALPWASQRA